MANKRHRPVWHPALLPTWLVVFLLFCLSKLPMPVKQSWGEKLGKLLHRKLKGRVKVCRKNIDGCFPELSDAEKSDLVEETFVACSKGFMETTHVWWNDVQPYIDNLIINGKEHLEEAQKRGKGILLIGGHFSIFDIALPFVASQLKKPGYMYRPNNNPVVDRMIEQGRHRYTDIESFDKRQLKDMIQFMKEGGEVWYAPDQDFGRKCEVFVPFFGISTGCITAPSWIARESGASVIHVSQYRHPNGQYEISFSPIFEGFGDNPAKDAADWNVALEAAIRRYPSQYLWLHKRFKTRQEGDEAFY